MTKPVDKMVSDDIWKGPQAFYKAIVDALSEASPALLGDTHMPLEAVVPIAQPVMHPHLEQAIAHRSRVPRVAGNGRV